jgi:hypothetical protein
MNIHITGQTGLNTFLSAIEGDINKNEDSLLYTTALYHIPKSFGDSRVDLVHYIRGGIR